MAMAIRVGIEMEMIWRRELVEIYGMGGVVCFVPVLCLVVVDTLEASVLVK